MEPKPESDTPKRPESDLRRLSSPEELDRVLTVVTPQVNWAVAASALATLALVLWVFFGRIPIKVTGNCIVMPENGLFGVESEASGIVREVSIKPGQLVASNELLLTIADSQLLLKLKGAKARSETLAESIERLKRQVELERTAEHAAVQKEIEAQGFVIQELIDAIVVSSNKLAATHKLFVEGVVSRQQLDAEAQELRSRETRYETAKAAMATLQSRFLQRHREEEYRTKELEFLTARNEYETLLGQRERGIIRSPASGTVVEALVAVGDYVEAGDPLAWLEHGRERGRLHRIYAYVPVDMGKLIEPETEVLVDFPAFSSQTYGSLVGQVSEVSKFAVSPEHLLKVVKNQSLVDHLTGGRSAVIQLIVIPETAADDPHQYLWLGGSGPSSPLTSGTVGALKAIVKRVAPITYIVPRRGG